MYKGGQHLVKISRIASRVYFIVCDFQSNGREKMCVVTSHSILHVPEAKKMFEWFHQTRISFIEIERLIGHAGTIPFWFTLNGIYSRSGRPSDDWNGTEYIVFGAVLCAGIRHNRNRASAPEKYTRKSNGNRPKKQQKQQKRNQSGYRFIWLNRDKPAYTFPQSNCP